MNSIPRIVTNSKLLITKDQSNNISLRLDPKECLSLALAGFPATFLERNEYSRLSPSEIDTLKSCGITIETTHYVNGLVQVELRTTNRVPDLVSLKNSIDSQVLRLLTDNDDSDISTVNKLWIRYQEYRSKLENTLRKKESTKIIEILEETKDALTQIGCLVLPEGFLVTIKHPQKFIDNVAPKVGLYAVSLIAVEINASKSAY